jgi:hypothetical protein
MNDERSFPTDPVEAPAMKLPHARFTMRRMMITGPLTALLLPPVLGLVWFLSPEQVRVRAVIDAYRAKAEHHAEMERKFSRLAEYSDSSHGVAIRSGRLVHLPIAQRPELVPRYLALAKYHRELRRKYEDAAWHPRRPVVPDPPEPE